MRDAIDRAAANLEFAQRHITRAAMLIEKARGEAAENVNRSYASEDTRNFNGAREGTDKAREHLRHLLRDRRPKVSP